MSKLSGVCVVEQTQHYGGFTLLSTLKQEYGIEDYA